MVDMDVEEQRDTLREVSLGARSRRRHACVKHVEGIEVEWLASLSATAVAAAGVHPVVPEAPKHHLAHRVL